MSRKPWQTLSKKILVKNAYLELWEDKIELPSGATGTYYITRKKPFSVIIPFFDNKLVLVEQYRPAVKAYSLEFPMGYAPDMAPLDIAKTELSQETGITAQKWHELGTTWVSAGNFSQIAHCYLAEELSFGQAQPESGEFLKVSHHTIDEVKELISHGTIRDNISIVAFHLFNLYLEKEKRL